VPVGLVVPVVVELWFYGRICMNDSNDEGVVMPRSCSEQGEVCIMLATSAGTQTECKGGDRE